VYTANLPLSLIGMEAGVGSHFLGQALRDQGHEVRLIPAQFVRPFVKSNKNNTTTRERLPKRGAGEHAVRAHEDGGSA
jgi:transposase